MSPDDIRQRIADLHPDSPEAQELLSLQATQVPAVKEEPHPAYAKVQLARHPKRPHSSDYISRIFTGFEELHGDRFYGDDKAMLGGYAFFEGAPVMVIGQQKGRDTKQKLARNFGMPKPEGYRTRLHCVWHGRSQLACRRRTRWAYCTAISSRRM